MNLTARKALATLVSSIYFTTQVALASATESNIWAERRKNQATQLAALPSFPVLNSLPSISPALPVTSKQNFPVSKKLQNLINGISLMHGTIQDIHDSGDDKNPPTVLVQDIHLNTEAQTNIAAILQELIDQKKIGLVSVEGAFAPFNFSPFRKYPDKKITQLVIEDFLNKNLLAAPSYVGITSPTEPPPFIGVDDRQHYDANAEALYSSRDQKERVTKQIISIKQTLIEQKRTVFSKELADFDNLRVGYHKGDIGIGAYAKKLDRMGMAHEYEREFVLDQFLSAYEMESTLDFKHVENERRTVIEKLTQALDEKEVNQLVAQSLAYRMGRLGFGAYYQNLKELCEKKGIRLGQTPNFENYIRYVLLSDGIKADALFKSIEKLEETLVAQLAKTDEEKKLTTESEYLSLVEKLVEFSLTPNEWEKYKNRHSRMSLSGIQSFERFYEEADIRSHKMVENLQNPILNSQASNSKVLIIGGFHSPQIAQLLRKEKISYVIVSPKITKIDDKSGSSYLSVFAREKTPLDRLFAGEKLFVYPEAVSINAPQTALVVDGVLATEHLHQPTTRTDGNTTYTFKPDPKHTEKGVHIRDTTVQQDKPLNIFQPLNNLLAKAMAGLKGWRKGLATIGWIVTHRLTAAFTETAALKLAVLFTGPSVWAFFGIVLIFTWLHGRLWDGQRLFGGMLLVAPLMFIPGWDGILWSSGTHLIWNVLSMRFSGLKPLSIAAPQADQKWFPVVEFVTAMQGNTGETLAKAVRESGPSLQKILNSISKSAAEVVRRAIRSLSFNQFVDLRTRPVIEILLNAIDTEERLNYKNGISKIKRVRITIRDGHVIIQDSGEGISIEDLTRLLNPGEGGNVVQSATTGRFGAGFLSVFSYLEGPNDRIIIRTKKETESNRYEFNRGTDGQLWMTQSALSPSAADRIKQGTEIEIVSSLIDAEEILTDAKRTLRYKDDALISVERSDRQSTILLNPQDNVETVGENRPQLRMRIPRNTGITSAAEKTDVLILINGVYFETITIDTYDEPKEVILDFHKGVFDYARDRSHAKPTQAVLKSFENLIDDLQNRYSNQPELLLKYVNLLYPVIDKIQKDTPPAKQGQRSANPTDKLKKIVARTIDSYLLRKTAVLRDEVRIRGALDKQTAVVFLHEDLLPGGRSRIPGELFDNDYSQIAYLPLSQISDPQYALLTSEGILLVDPSLKSALSDPTKQDEVLASLQSFIDVSIAAGEGQKPHSALIQLTKPPKIPDDNHEFSADAARSEMAEAPEFANENRLLIEENLENRLQEATTIEEFYFYNRLIAALHFVRSDELANQFNQSFWDSLPNHFRFHADGKPIEPFFSENFLGFLKTGTVLTLGLQSSSFLKAQLELNDDQQIKQELVIFFVFKNLEHLYNERAKGRASYYRIDNPQMLRMYMEGRKLGSIASTKEAFSRVLQHIGILINEGYSIRIKFAYGPGFTHKDHFASAFEDLPEYVKTDDWRSIYRNLLFSLYEKQPLDPDDKVGFKKMVNELDTTFRSLVTGLSENEAKDLKDNFMHFQYRDDDDKKEIKLLFGHFISFDYEDIREALKVHGAFGFRLASHLHQLFGDSPPLDQKPSTAIMDPPATSIEMNVSDLILGMGQNEESETRFQSIRDASELKRFDDEQPAQNSSELRSRAQSAIRRAYEQTTDAFSFLREIVTNAYEAVRAKGKPANGVPRYQVRSWVDNGYLVVSMKDEGVGMDLQDIIGKLLQPSASGWASDWLHFGQGFFTLFRAGDEVRVRSTKNGITITVYLTPIRRNDSLVDVHMRVSQETATASPGTTVEWRQKTGNPSLLASELWVRIRNYVGLFDKTKMRVMWNNELVNAGAKPLAEIKKMSTGEGVTILAAVGERAFNLNQFFMRDLNTHFTYPIPTLFLDVLLKHGIVLNLDSVGAQPLEGRTDFVGRSNKIREFSNAIALAGVVAASKLFAQGKANLDEVLPHDYILGAKSYKPSPESFIAQDAARVTAGKSVRDWTPYTNGERAKRNSVLLLLSLPVITIDGLKYSCFDALIHGQEDEEFFVKLPLWLKIKIERAKSEEALGEALMKASTLANEIKEQVDPSTVDAREPDTAILVAWKNLVEVILSTIDAASTSPPIHRHEFFSSLSATIAHTTVGDTNIAWNVAAIYEQLKTLHELLVNGTSDNGDIHRLFYRLIETTTHEKTHINRGESEYEFTHDHDFFRDQLKILNVILAQFINGKSGLNLSDNIARSAQEYKPDPTFELPERFRSIEAVGGTLYSQRDRWFPRLSYRQYGLWIAWWWENLRWMPLGVVVGVAVYVLTGDAVSAIRIGNISTWMGFFGEHLFDYAQNKNRAAGERAPPQNRWIAGGLAIINSALSYLPLSSSSLVAVLIISGFIIHLAVNISVSHSPPLQPAQLLLEGPKTQYAKIIDPKNISRKEAGQKPSWRQITWWKKTDLVASVPKQPPQESFIFWKKIVSRFLQKQTPLTLPVVWAGRTGNPAQNLEQMTWNSYKQAMKEKKVVQVDHIPAPPVPDLGYDYNTDQTDAETAAGFIDVFLGPLAPYAAAGNRAEINLTSEDVRHFIQYSPYADDFIDLLPAEQEQKITEFIETARRFREAIQSKEAFISFLRNHNRSLSVENQQHIELAETLVGGDVDNRLIVIDPMTTIGKLFLMAPTQLYVVRGRAFSISLDNNEAVKFAFVIDRSWHSDGRDTFYKFRVCVHELLHVRYLPDDYRHRGNQWIALHEGVVEYLNRQLLIGALEVDHPVIQRMTNEILKKDTETASFKDRIKNRFEKISSYPKQYLYVRDLVRRYGEFFLTEVGHDSIWNRIQAETILRGSSQRSLVPAASIVAPLFTWLNNYSWGKWVYGAVVVLVSPVWETFAFHGNNIGNMSLMVLVGTILFAFAHTVVKWLVRSVRGDKVFVKQDALDFLVRAGLGLIALVISSKIDPQVTMIAHALYNGAVLAGLLPEWMVLGSIVNGHRRPIALDRINRLLDLALDGQFEKISRQLLGDDVQITDPNERKILMRVGLAAHEIIKNALDYITPKPANSDTNDGLTVVTAFNTDNGSFSISFENPGDINPALFTREKLLALRKMIEHLWFMIDPGNTVIPPHPELAHLKPLPDKVELLSKNTYLLDAIYLINKKIEKLDRSQALNFEDAKELIFTMLVTTKIDLFRENYFYWEGKTSHPNNRAGGQGIGLAFSKMHLADMSIDLDLESGNGSTRFIITIPANLIKPRAHTETSDSDKPFQTPASQIAAQLVNVIQDQTKDRHAVAEAILNIVEVDKLFDESQPTSGSRPVGWWEVAQALEVAFVELAKNGDLNSVEAGARLADLTFMLRFALTEAERNTFIGSIEQILNEAKFKDTTGFAVWVDDAEKAKAVMAENQGVPVVLGMREEKREEIMAALGQDIPVVTGDDSMTALNFINQARQLDVFKNKPAGMLNLLVMDGVAIPVNFFNLTAKQREELERQAFIFFVTQTLQAVEINASQLPDWQTIRERLIQA